MNRLTKLAELSDVQPSSKYDVFNKQMSVGTYTYKLYEAIDKLGELEDLEEELRIDLITLFKALKNGIWYKNEYGQATFSFVTMPSKFVENSQNEIDHFSNFILLSQDYGYDFMLSDYGKTWALTKEELEGK